MSIARRSRPHSSDNQLLMRNTRARLRLQDAELTEITYSLNALLEALDAINPPGLENIEALPIILPPK